MYLTIATIREELQDRNAEDNTIDGDQFFSDDEIMHAMRRTAAEANSMSPLGVGMVSAECLPSEVSGFLDGVLSKLYGAAVNKLARNVMSWSTGGVTVDLEKTRLELFGMLKKELNASFKDSVMQYKMELNRDSVWGSY